MREGVAAVGSLDDSVGDAGTELGDGADAPPTDDLIEHGVADVVCPPLTDREVVHDARDEAMGRMIAGLRLVQMTQLDVLIAVPGAPSEFGCGLDVILEYRQGVVHQVAQPS